MSGITISDNVILWEFDKGTSASCVINKADGWAMYDEIVMELKPIKDINALPSLRLIIGSGLTVTGTSLLIEITYAQTKALRNKTIHADIKLKAGEEVTTPIPFLITNNNSVTDL